MKVRAAVVLVTVLGLAGPAAAQSTHADRYDISGVLTWLNVGSFDETAVGVGGRIAYHLVDLLSLDVEANGFPTDDLVTGRKLEAFAGVKLGGRSRVFGLFGKVRPG